MEKNIKKIFILLISVCVFLFFSKVSESRIDIKKNQSNFDSSVFRLGTFITGYGSISPTPGGDVYNWHFILPYFRDQFGFNSCVFYNNPLLYGSPFEGGLYNNTSQYIDYIKFFVSQMNEAGILGSYDRGAIRTLCGSQCSIYQAEDSIFYGFKNNGRYNTGMYFDSAGISGKCGIKGIHPPGFLISGLIENAEQSDTWSVIGVGGIDDSTWYLKPRMRIKPADAEKFSDIPIAKIDIVGFNGKIIKSVSIKGKNFSQNGKKYDGSFTEEYFNFEGDTNLSFSGDVKPGGLNYLATTDFDSCFNFKSCKVDYRIWWFGVCNMWVDYVKVEDKIAYHLLDLNDMGTGKLFRDKICDEIKAIKDNVRYIHYDEIRKNNIPSLIFVQHIIDSITDKKIKILPVGLPAINNELKNKYKDAGYYLQSVNPEYLFTDCYPFGCTTKGNDYFQTWLPPNLKIIRQSLKFLKKDYNEYMERIQYNRIGDKNVNWDPTVSLKNYSLVAFLNRMTTDAISAGKDHIITLQVHSELKENTSGQIEGICLREPTNEEIRLQTSLSLCYGVRGIYYFAFAGTPPPDQEINSYESVRLMSYNPLLNKNTAVPVTFNSYGQNKYEAMKIINKNTIAIGSILKKLKWEGAYSVHSEGANHNYIEDIISEFYYQNQDYPGCKIGSVLCDCREKRFWELGFFSSNLPGDKNANYFMAVNRRTVPDSPEGSGDVRILKIKFAKNQLNSYRKWKLTDVYTNQYIIFDAMSDDYINLESIGVFLPGEGKLFKLEPVK